MPKGYRKDGGLSCDNGKQLTELTTEFRQFSEYTKKRAIAQRAKAKVRQDVLPVWQDNIEAYRIECQRRGKPMTNAGVALACDISIDTYYKTLNGDNDYVTEEFRLLNGIDENETLLTPSDVLKRAALLIQNQLEENCYQNRGNPAGSIFGLKARYGWQDDVAQQTTNNTLVIADKDKALQLLNMVNPDSSLP